MPTTLANRLAYPIRKKPDLVIIEGNVAVNTSYRTALSLLTRHIERHCQDDVSWKVKNPNITDDVITDIFDQSVHSQLMVIKTVHSSTG